jgi:hypothetical protein
LPQIHLPRPGLETPPPPDAVDEAGAVVGAAGAADRRR